MVGHQHRGGFYANPLVGYSASLPWHRAEANIGVVNTWTKIIGNHTIKFGGDLRRLRDDLLQDQTFNPRGFFNFNTATDLRTAPAAPPQDGLSTISPVSCWISRPRAAAISRRTSLPTGNGILRLRAGQVAGTPKLTLDFGLRWEFYPPPTPAFPGGFSNYNPVNNTLVLAGIGNNPMNKGMQKN